MVSNADEREKHKLSAEGARRWRARIQLQIELNGWPSERDWCMRRSVSQSTLNDQTKRFDSLPKIDTLLTIADDLGYPVAEQIADLSGRRLEHIAPPEPFDVAHISMLDLHDRLDTALRTVGNRRPTVTDVTRSVLNSSHRDRPLEDGASPYARWRARLFDVPMGWHFPHVGYHGVEFMRWYGPGRGRDDDRYTASAWWGRAPRSYSYERVRGYVAKFWSGNTPPKSFTGTSAEWQAFRLERLELVARMQNLYPRADLTPYGGYGESWRALLRHSDGSALRHLFTQQASWSRPDPARSRPCADDDVRLVVIAGTSSVRPVAVGSLIGEALGWETVGFRTMQATLTGARPISSQNDDVVDGTRDNTWRRARALAHKRDQPLLMTTNVNYLLHEINGVLQLTEPARELFADPAVLIVFLQPSDTSGTAESNAARARSNAASGRPSTRETVEWARRAAAVIAEVARESPQLVTLDIEPTYVHWGDAYLAPDESREYLWHPTVGDLDVRVAAEAAHLLSHRLTVGQVPPTRLRENLRAFDEGSVVGSFADRLFEATSHSGRRGAPWNHAIEHPGWTARSTWDEIFTRPPLKEDVGIVHQFGSAVTAPVRAASPWLTQPV